MKMNRRAYTDNNNNNNNNAYGASGEYRMVTRTSSFSSGVVCPKPRRVSIFNLSNYQVENCDSRAGSELLDLFLTRGNYGFEKSNHQVPSSPPFYMGSPPIRASNPVVHDSHFGINKSGSFSPATEASPSSQRSNGGCARAKFGEMPATVRIEGFNCRGNCSVSAVA